MGIEDGIPPLRPPPPIDSPLLTPALDRFPAFDFASGADFSLFDNGIDFESPNGLDFASGTRLSEVSTNGFSFDTFAMGLDSPTAMRGPVNFDLLTTPVTDTMINGLSHTPLIEGPYRIVACVHCGTSVKCYPKSDGPMHVHLAGKRCAKQQARNRQQKEAVAALSSSCDLRAPVPLPTLAYAPINLPEQLALNVAISKEELVALGVQIGISDAPQASVIAPAPRRGQKRPALDDLTNVESRALTRRKTA
ncbi:hypothetical protein C8R45DRAFT_1158663 [Mycena sanguinolenta]|nr:hypothetical protein C8R45DRAFT_1158663 [Mycena sanguinolenta]